MGVHKSQEIVHLILGSFYIIVLALIPSSDHFELNSALFVIGYVGQDVILPCQSSSGALPQNVEVQWKKTVDDNTENIYQFTSFTGQETFGQGYESRAVFATEGLDTGNVSLMLKMAEKADEGSYSCIAKTKDWGAQTQTVLVVESSKGNSTLENSCASIAFWVTFVFLLLALLALAVTIWTFKHKGAREMRTLSQNEEQSVAEGLLQGNRTVQDENGRREDGHGPEEMTQGGSQSAPFPEDPSSVPNWIEAIEGAREMRTLSQNEEQSVAEGLLQGNGTVQDENVDVIPKIPQPEVSRDKENVSDTGNICPITAEKDYRENIPFVEDKQIVHKDERKECHALVPSASRMNSFAYTFHR